MKKINLICFIFIFFHSSFLYSDETSSLDDIEYIPFMENLPAGKAGVLQIFNASRDRYIDGCSRVFKGAGSDLVDVTNARVDKLGETIEAVLTKAELLQLIIALDVSLDLTAYQLADLVSNQLETYKVVFSNLRFERIKDNLLPAVCGQGSSSFDCIDMVGFCEDKLTKLPDHYFTNNQTQIIEESVSSGKVTIKLEEPVIIELTGENHFIIGSQSSYLDFFEPDGRQSGGTPRVRVTKRPIKRR